MNTEEALRRVVLWQHMVLRDPERVMKGLGDPMSIAVGLFVGPIWDDAFRALSEESRASLRGAFKKSPNE